MLKSLITYVKLCVGRGNPADVDGRTPAIVFLFLIFLILHSAMVWGILLMLEIDSSHSEWTIRDEVFRVLGTICGQLFVALCVYVVLHVRSIPQSFRSAYSSYLGVSIIIALVSIALILASVLLSAVFDPFTRFGLQEGYLTLTGTMLIVSSSVFVVSTAWKILAFGYVLYKTMGLKFWHCAVMAIMLTFAPEALKMCAELLRYVGFAVGYIFDFGYF